MKRFVCLLALLLLLTATAAAENKWLIRDSDTRPLTQQELLGWDLEALGYVQREIYARHGYHFAAGSDYEAYFTAQEWYKPHTKNNVEGCYVEMTELEWQNVDLIQQIMTQMWQEGNLNLDKGRSVWSDEVVASPLNFVEVSLPRNQKYSVYSAPGNKSWRGAKNKAAVSTNGPVWAAGWVKNWLLIYYETSKGSVRVGYIKDSSIPKDLSVQTKLVFAETSAVITRKCTLTDDITRAAAEIKTLKKGAKVTYLAPYYGDKDWAYIETTVDKKTVRGFVPLDCLEEE